MKRFHIPIRMIKVFSLVKIYVEFLRNTLIKVGNFERKVLCQRLLDNKITKRHVHKTVIKNDTIKILYHNSNNSIHYIDFLNEFISLLYFLIRHTTNPTLNPPTYDNLI